LRIDEYSANSLLQLRESTVSTKMFYEICDAEQTWLVFVTAIVVRPP